MAFPFLTLDALGPVAAFEAPGPPEGDPIVIFWDRHAEAAAAFNPEVGGRSLTFGVEGGAILDRQTSSHWSVDGRAVSGDLEGARLRRIKGSYVAYWFAWAAFQPDTEIWSPGGS